jgi:hypothetical protein
VYTYLKLLIMQILGEMVHGREKLNSVLDSAPQKFINLAEIFKKVSNSCKNAGLCNLSCRLLITRTCLPLLMNRDLPVALLFFGCLILKVTANPVYPAFLVILLVTWNIGGMGGNGDDKEDMPNLSYRKKASFIAVKPLKFNPSAHTYVLLAALIFPK